MKVWKLKTLVVATSIVAAAAMGQASAAGMSATTSPSTSAGAPAPTDLNNNAPSAACAGLTGTARADCVRSHNPGSTNSGMSSVPPAAGTRSSMTPNPNSKGGGNSDSGSGTGGGTTD